MTERNKIFAGCLAFLFLVFHVSSIFIYAAPPQVMPEKAKTFVTPYVSPMFEQSWAMFAPCPLIDGGIEIKINSSTDSTDWFRPAEDALFWHRWVRMTHFGEIALLEANLLWWVYYDIYDLDLELDSEIPDFKQGFFKDGKCYTLIKRYIYGAARNLNLEPISAEAVCSIENVKTGESGELKLPVFKW